MVKCATCGTAWTTAGLPLCPVCGTRVDELIAPSTAPNTDRRPDRVSVIDYAPLDGSGHKASNGSAVLDVAPELRTAELRIPAPVQDPVGDPLPEPRQFPPLKRVEPAPDGAPTAARMPETRALRLPEAIEALDVVPALPAPAGPMNGPLILGLLAMVPPLMFPLTLAFEGTRVLGILGFCMSGFFAPFAPIAWLAGGSAEKRRRDQGLRPERRVSIGRRLGQGATLILVAEMTAALVGIAALRLSGQFPNSFWSGL